MHVVLNEADFQKLEDYADAGGRISYYDYLSERGDSYARLATSVVQTR